MRKNFIGKSGNEKKEEEIKEELLNFIAQDDFKDLDDKPRIMLVASDFRREVTATVLWLRKFGVDISCIKLMPYKIDDEKIGFISYKIIPLPEAEEYMIKSQRKENVKRTLTRTQEEYLKFWRELIHTIKSKIPVSLNEPQPQSWYSIPTGIKGVHFEWKFHGQPRSKLGVELHFEKGDKETNINLLNEIEKYKKEFENKIGEKVIIDKHWRNNWTRLYIEKNEGNMTEELKKWAIEKMTIFYKFFQPELEKLGKKY